jgi:chemotaxis protein MotB
MQSQLNDLQDRYSSMEQTKNEWAMKYDQLLNSNQSVLETATSEKMQLSEELLRKTNDLNAKEKRLKELESGLKSQQSELASTKTSLADREKRVKDLEGVLKAQEEKMTALRSKVMLALKNFSDKDFQVREQNGKLYVSLSQQLLFGTGSSVIDQKGVEAIKQLASVLNNNPETDIAVEGHTDNTGTADINWQLSLDRANSVVKILTINKVDGKRISATGRAMFLPVADNTTPDGKAKNRRTEIILSPKLDALYDLINNK